MATIGSPAGAEALQGQRNCGLAEFRATVVVIRLPLSPLTAADGEGGKEERELLRLGACLAEEGSSGPGRVQGLAPSQPRGYSSPPLLSSRQLIPFIFNELPQIAQSETQSRANGCISRAGTVQGGSSRIHFFFSEGGGLPPNAQPLLLFHPKTGLPLNEA